MQHASISQSLARVFQIPLQSRKFTNPNPYCPIRHALATHLSHPRFSSTTSTVARKQQNKTDKRITLIRYHLHHPLTPRPLHLSRNRTLRHWTIHRAYILHSLKTRDAEKLELERQYNAMRDACEELRIGVGDGGRLYRQAMVKKGVYGGVATHKGEGEGLVERGREGGVPVEYARAQTEGPSREGWNEGWMR